MINKALAPAIASPRRARRSRRRAPRARSASRGSRVVHVAAAAARGTLGVELAARFDTPPPTTITSGSRMLITMRECARQAVRVDRASPPPRRRASLLAALAPVRRRTARCSRGGRSCTAARDAPRAVIHGSGVWPHSPAMPWWPCSTSPLAPRCRRRRRCRGSRRTPRRCPAPAPSIASDSAKQLASLAKRDFALEHRFEVVLQPAPVERRVVGVDRRGRCAGAIVPGMPTPTVQRSPASFSASRISSANSSSAASYPACGVGDAPPHDLARRRRRAPRLRSSCRPGRRPAA